MKLAFIYPAQFMSEGRYTKELWKHYSQEGICVPQLGIAYLAACLLEEGHDVRIIDANASKLTIEATCRALYGFSADILLFTSITENFANTVFWIKEIRKKLPEPIIIIGGPHASLYPMSTMMHNEIDVCVIGDGSQKLINVVKELSNSCKPNGLDKIQGILYRSNDEVVQTKSDSTFKKKIDLDALPFPARHLLPNDRYKTVISKRHPITSMLSSMGCPFMCVYCDTNYHVVMRNPDMVVKEMEYCNKQLGIKEILFYDETFTLNNKRAFAICDLLIKRGLDLTFSIRTRADTVTEELVQQLAKAGCIRINYGIESGNQNVLKNIKRNIPLQQIKNAVAWTKKHGIDAFGFFMIGCPGDDYKTINETIDFALSLDLDYAQFNKLTLVPNSELYHRVKEKAGIDFWDEYTKGDFDIVKTMPRIDVHVDDKELDSLLKRAYKRFYYRPRLILRQLFNIRSHKEFIKLSKSALTIIK